MFMPMDLRDVPIDRLITNIEHAEKRCNDNACKATMEYRIARLHSMRYARAQETVTVKANDENSKTVMDPVLPPYESYRWPDYRQYESVAGAVTDNAREALDLAVLHYRLSNQLQPGDPKTLLGLGWCLKEQKHLDEACDVLREAISAAKTREENINYDIPSRIPMISNGKLAQEAAQYLIPLLNPSKDKKELDALSQLGKPDYELHGITPIVMPTSATVPLSQMMRKARVVFDIGGFGKTLLHEWPSHNAGWLVWHPHSNTPITSGKQLIGSSSFWIFWSDGYEVLSALDDNHNGKLERKELDGLATWIDGNSDGKSNTKEIHTLHELGIQSLSCNGKYVNGYLANPHGVKFASGLEGATCDWIYKSHIRLRHRLANR